jgi:sarcosine oxidase, subunit gamma
MAESPERVSPLHRFAEPFAAASEVPAIVRIAEVPYLSQLTLRVAPATPSAAAVERVLGAALPVTPNTAVRTGEADVLWMAPDEWLIVAPEGAGASLAARLRAAVEGHHATIVDVSAQRTVVELSGSAAGAVLAKGCSLDLHPRAFGPGRCAQTALARAGVILLARGDELAWWIFVRASFAGYLGEWLLDASAEYRGVPADDLSLGELETAGAAV